eukprot:TRINITY_DN6765_c0_g1_i15.p1 TRINITY_DN6765_c0_g1~~TRINITY_DN6765_c0_g1_i15.p1  ORF type:complete len:182 (-),score=35.08 TRINITY_DN6765_c0_g1_i15:483-1028(-)
MKFGMHVHLLSLLFVIGGSLCYVPLSKAAWEQRMQDLEPLVKRGYVIHNANTGYPRYTTLVRRNFIRFGKRSGGGANAAFTDEHSNNAAPSFRAPPAAMTDPESYLTRESMGYDDDDTQDTFHQSKRDRSFIRFGKRAQRYSNFIRFGRSQPMPQNLRPENFANKQQQPQHFQQEMDVADY